MGKPGPSLVVVCAVRKGKGAR